MRVLVTGATGNLGRQLVPKLGDMGHDVVALTRRSLDAAAGVRWVLGDLATGEGIDEATRDCDAVVHAATAGFGDAYNLRWAILHRATVDVHGTSRLLAAAREAGISHLVFPSIVGVDRVPGFASIYRYFKHKLEAERLVRESPIPWTVVRLTQFHPLLNQVFQWQFNLPAPVIVMDAQGQPIDPSDAADEVIQQLAGDAEREVVEVGGPEVLQARELVGTWCTRRGTNRKVHFVRARGKAGRAIAEGALTAPGHAVGTVTWSDWLSDRF